MVRPCHIGKATPSVLHRLLTYAPEQAGERSTAVSLSKSSSYIEAVLQDPKNRLAFSALSANNPATILERQSAILKDTQTFNIKIPTEGSPVTNQRSSGRCWIFAATNVLRVAVMKKYGLDKFELSQNYLFFWYDLLSGI